MCTNLAILPLSHSKTLFAYWEFLYICLKHTYVMWCLCVCASHIPSLLFIFSLSFSSLTIFHSTSSRIRIEIECVNSMSTYNITYHPRHHKAAAEAFGIASDAIYTHSIDYKWPYMCLKRCAYMLWLCTLDNAIYTFFFCSTVKRCNYIGRDIEDARLFASN